MKTKTILKRDMLMFCFLLLLACKSENKETESKNIPDTTATPVQLRDTANVEPSMQENQGNKYTELGRFFEAEQEYTVIYQYGAPMFSKPTEDSRTISTIAYGETVVVVENPVTDTEFDSLRRQDSIPEVFVRIAHGNTEGYILNSHLMAGKYEAPGGDVHLLFQGGSCVANFRYNPSFQYYALYGSNEGYDLKKVKPVFSVSHNPFDEIGNYEWYNVHTGQELLPMFIVGYHGNLEESRIRTIDWESERHVVTDAYTMKVESTDDHMHHITLTFVSPEGNVLQKLETVDLIWCGDLDKDGKLDFVYMEGEEGSGEIVFSLSSKIKGDEVIKAIATFPIAPCC